MYGRSLSLQVPVNSQQLLFCSCQTSWGFFLKMIGKEFDMSCALPSFRQNLQAKKKVSLLTVKKRFCEPVRGSAG